MSVDGNDRFIMKMLDSANLSTIEHELPLKLARKSVNVFGTSVIEEGKTKNQVDFGYDEETVRYGLKYEVNMVCQILSQVSKVFF